MAERRGSGSKDISLASPLYSTGVERVEVNSPCWGAEVPDPMGYMSSEGTIAGHMSGGGGDQEPGNWAYSLPED